MVNKILSTYQRQEPKDVFDLYCYLNNKPKHNLQKLIKLVERKFGIAIESTTLLAKINELATQLNLISPLLLIPQKDLTKKVKKLFQNIFNSIAKKQIK
jgi:predicted nucleotidyltransferase component of viral defense system